MTTRCARCSTPITSGDADGRCARCSAAAYEDRTGRAPADAASSGLIDVRAMLALLDAEEEHEPLGLAPSIPLRRRQPPSSASSGALRRGRRGRAERGLSALALSLAVAFVGLAGYAVVARDAAAPVHVEITSVLRGSEPPPRDDVDSTTEEVHLVREAPTDGGGAAAAPEAQTDGAAAPAQRAAKPRTRRRSDRDGAASKATPESPGASTPTETPGAKEAAAAKQRKDWSVDCLLEPQGCQEAKAPRAATPAPAPPSGPALPATLEARVITAELRSFKEAAERSCRSLAATGERVQIKLSIDGPRGVVSATRIEAGGANPKLAACCARELARATFPKVQKAKIGALATVRF